MRYYANGRTAQVVDPLGNVMTLTYNPFKSETVAEDSRGFNTIYRYNQAGNLISRTNPDQTVDSWTYDRTYTASYTDALGNTTVYDYLQNNPRSVIDPTFVFTLFTYDSTDNRWLTDIQCPGGRNSHVVPDANGNVTSFLDAVGNTQTFVPNAQGLPSPVTDGRNNSISYVYNSAGQWISQTTDLPSTTEITYNTRGTIDHMTDAEGHVTSFGYDLLDRVTTITDAESNTTTYSYNALGQLESATDANGNQTQFEYDLADRLSGVVDPNGRSRRLEYDERGNVVAEIDELGRTSRTEYDSRNRPKRVTTPDGATASWTYDGAGRVSAVTSPLGNQAAYAYDDAGRQTDHYDANGKRSYVSSFDENGNVEVSVDRRGASTTYEYDALNRVTEVRGPENLVRTFDYDENGNVEEVADYDVLGLGSIPDDPRTLPAERKRVWSYTYDVLNRVEMATDPEGESVTIDYDKVGNVRFVTDQRGNVTETRYDDANRPEKLIRPDTGEVVLGHDGKGNVTSLHSPTGGTYGWEYDSRNRPIAVTDPKGRTTRFDYDAVGNPIRTTNPDGTWISVVYDALNRPVLERLSDGSYTSWTYDLDGRLVRTATEATEVEFVYDSLGRVTSETQKLLSGGVSKTVSFEYDDEGTLELITDPEGRTIDYGRDALGRLTTVTDSAGPTATIGYNGYSERETIGYGNGTAGVYDYDKVGRVTRIDWTNAVLNVGYPRDAAGNPTPIDEIVIGTFSENLTIAYDTLNRPTSVVALWSPALRSETFDFDLNDNVIDPGDASTSTFDTSDQLIAGASGQYSYDARGNRIAVDNGVIRVETPHDPSGALTAIRVLTNGVLTHETTFVRDGLGRLVETRSGTDVTRSVYAFNNRLVEYDELDAVTATYTLGDGLDDVFAVVLDGTVRYLHHDAVNSVRAITNGTGSIAGYRQYSQFGRVLASNGVPELPLGFTGRPFHAESGLVDLRARFYDPATSAFLGRDPMGLAASGPNPYAYAANRPGYLVDPLGLEPSGLFGADPIQLSALSLAAAAMSVEVTPWGVVAPQYRAWDIGPGFNPATVNNLYGLAEGGVYGYVDENIARVYSNMGQPFGFEYFNKVKQQLFGAISFATESSASSPGDLALGLALNLYAAGPTGIGTTAGREAAWADLYAVEAIVADGIASAAIPVAGALAERVVGATRFGRTLSKVARGITNPIPQRLARVVPGSGPVTTLGREGAHGVFVTAADDIAGMNAAQIAERVGIPPSGSFTIIEFGTPPTGLASPVFRTNPGFVGGGLTSGGAREFVLPNGPIPADAVIRVVP